MHSVGEEDTIFEEKSMRNGIKRQALLTGAGFTMNFGGLSGTQFMNLLFSNDELKQAANVFKMLKAPEADYESVYRDVMEPDSGFSQEEQAIVIRAYDAAYSEMDRRICEACTPPAPVSMNALSTLLDCFAGAEGQRETGYIFTLNQDIFVERGYIGNATLTTPAVPNPRFHHRWVAVEQWEENGHGPFPERTAPTRERVQEERAKPPHRIGRLQYVKLHGSMNWRRSDGSAVMVIAGRKEDQIAAEPLLEWYSGLLTTVTCQDDAHLLIIGYGFGDPHINRILALASRDHGLTCSLIHPEANRRAVFDQLLTRCNAVAREEGHEDYSTDIEQSLDRGQYRDERLSDALQTQGTFWKTTLGRWFHEHFGPQAGR